MLIIQWFCNQQWTTRETKTQSEDCRQKKWNQVNMLKWTILKWFQEETWLTYSPIKLLFKLPKRYSSYKNTQSCWLKMTVSELTQKLRIYWTQETRKIRSMGLSSAWIITKIFKKYFHKSKIKLSVKML
jgi:hypothetical protein